LVARGRGNLGHRYVTHTTNQWARRRGKIIARRALPQVKRSRNDIGDKKRPQRILSRQGEKF